MNMPDPVRVLLVDDAAESRQTLRRALAFDPEIEVVGEASSGDEAVIQAESLRPDVVLMDVRMPDSDGVGATEHITQRFPQTRVLALTAHDDQGSVREMLTAGAIGYLVKGAPVDDLVSAIRGARQGEGKLDDRVLPHVLEDLRTLLQEEQGRRAEAERLARAREDFIQVLSHELRTPLTVIAGALQFLEGAQLPPGSDELVSAALRRIEDLERVAEGLELIGEGPPGVADVANPAEAFSRVLGGLPDRPDSVDGADESWVGVRDQHVARVTLELVTNALSHGQRPITLRAYRRGSEGVVEVTDAGDFEPDPKLFAAFTQADMSTRRERGGLGLGLFVSARLCELGRGRLDLRRENGRTVAEARFRLRD
jgi:DNA-binding NarL/FixJ family response regulator